MGTGTRGRVIGDTHINITGSGICIVGTLELVIDMNVIISMSACVRV